MTIGGWNPIHLDGLGDTDADFCLSPHTPRATTLEIRDIGFSGIIRGWERRERTVTLKLCTPVEFISSRKLARELSV